MKAKHIYSALVGLFAVICMVNCNYLSPIKAQVEQMKKDLPMYVEDHLQLVDVVYNESTVEFIYECNGNYSDPKKIKIPSNLLHETKKDPKYNMERMKEKPWIMKNAMRLNIVENEEVKPFLRLLALEKGAIKFTYKDAVGSDKVTVTFSHKELEALKDSNLTPKQFIETTVGTSYMITPMTIDEVTVLDSMVLVDDCLYYMYTVDENQVSYSAMKSGEGQLQQALEEVINNKNKDLEEILSNLKLLGYSLGYKYIADKTQRVVEVKAKP